jgi:hypothetical protein
MLHTSLQRLVRYICSSNVYKVTLDKRTGMKVGLHAKRPPPPPPSPILTKIQILRLFFLKSSSFKCVETPFTCSRIRTSYRRMYRFQYALHIGANVLKAGSDVFLTNGIAVVDLIRDRDTSFL